MDQSDKPLAKYFDEEAFVPPQKAYATKAADEFDMDSIPGLDEAQDRVEVMRAGGGEVLEASNECESGACAI